MRAWTFSPEESLHPLLGCFQRTGSLGSVPEFEPSWQHPWLRTCAEGSAAATSVACIVARGGTNDAELAGGSPSYAWSPPRYTKLDPERRLPRHRRSRDQDDVPPRNATKQNLVEPPDSCLHRV